METDRGKDTQRYYGAGPSAEKNNAEHESLLRRIDEIFSSDKSHGTPHSPTSLGFLSLQTHGSTLWNAWRKEYPDSDVDLSNLDLKSRRYDFSGFDFSGEKNKKINFRNTIFGSVSFERCVFYSADFSSCVFEKNFSFNESLFKGKSSFKKIKTKGKAKFKGVEFRANTSFYDATFSIGADFENGKFYGSTDFSESQFNGQALMRNAEFDDVNFASAWFRERADFCHCKFGRDQSFRQGKLWGDSTEEKEEISFKNAEFSKEADFEATIFYKNANFSCSSEFSDKKELEIKYIYFSGAIIRSTIIFSNRKFIGKTDFGRRDSIISTPTLNSKGSGFLVNQIYPPTKFYEPPVFHGCKLHQNTIFEGAEFLTAPSPEAARAYRTLKVAMEQFKATREEQKFYLLEMKAEHKSLSLGRRWVSKLYELFSNYGFSLWRPIQGLIAFSLLFATGHILLANACTKDPECIQSAIQKDKDMVLDSKRNPSLVKYTLASVAPVPGLDKMQTELRAPLFGEHGWIAVAAVLLEIGHKIVTLVMTFLFALALRNLFKMKS